MLDSEWNAVIGVDWRLCTVFIEPTTMLHYHYHYHHITAIRPQLTANNNNDDMY